MKRVIAEEPRISPTPEPDEGLYSRHLHRLEVAIVFGLFVLGCVFTYRYLLQDDRGRNAQMPSRPAILVPDLFEGESLKVLGKSREFVWVKQDTSTFPEGQWTGNAHMFASQTQQGDWIELALPVAHAGKYHAFAYLTQSIDYGVIRFTINGKRADQDYDLYSGGWVIKSTGAAPLGTFTLKEGEARLRLEVVGRNPNNNPPHFQFGMDGIRLEKVK